MNDNYRPDRGIAYGILFGVPLWLLLILFSCAALAEGQNKIDPGFPSPPKASADAVAEASVGPIKTSAVGGPSNAVNEGVTVSGDDSRYLAVGLAGVAAAATAYDCHESYGGKSGLGIGTGGRSVINVECQAFQQCMARVQAYIALEASDLAIRELQVCGGQPPPETQTYGINDVCEERRGRIEAACLEK